MKGGGKYKKAKNKIRMEIKFHTDLKCRPEDLNPQPTDYKSVALPIELGRQKKKRWWLRTESNRRHMDFQSIALPTELLSQLLNLNGGPDGTRTRDLLRDRQAF